jgi:hypothetical protein
MKKNKDPIDNTYSQPTDEIQAKITELMGLPIEQADPTLNKTDNSNINIKKIKKGIAVDKETRQEVDALTKNDIESPETDQAVKEIVQSESDLLLSQQDQKVKDYTIDTKPKKGLKRLLINWWQNKKLRYTTFGLILAVITLILIIPTTRYATLNIIGVRASTNFIVTDKISGRPIKNVTVNINEATAQSNNEGKVEFNDLKLGKANLSIQKRSFEPINSSITIGWGSNPLQAPFELVPTGTTFKFTITDWLDDALLKDIEVSDGESTAISDENGVANLTIEPTDEDISITISGNNYRNEVITIPADSVDPLAIKLTALKPDVFISKRSGKFDLYKRDIDGKNEKLILPATGSETEETYALVSNLSNDIGALVSTREGKRNQDGYLLSDLFMIDLNAHNVSKVEGTSSERIRIIGWEADSIIFVKTIAGPSASFGTRQRIIAYDHKLKNQKELASSDYFVDVRLISGKVYYSINNGYNDGSGSGLNKIDINGQNRKTLIGGNIWSVYRTEKDYLTVSAEGSKWYKVAIKEDKLETLNGAPAQLQDVKYFEYQDKIARIEQRDGKTELLVKASPNGEEKLVIRRSGISLPVLWLNDKTILFGVVTNDETARYVVSLQNNKAVKVGDNTASYYDGNLYY